MILKIYYFCGDINKVRDIIKIDVSFNNSVREFTEIFIEEGIVELSCKGLIGEEDKEEYFEDRSSYKGRRSKMSLSRVIIE